MSSDFFSISSVAVYNLEIRKRRKINAKSKQTNSVRKRKKIHTPVEYYLCQTMMLLLLKKTRKNCEKFVFL